MAYGIAGCPKGFYMRAVFFMLYPLRTHLITATRSLRGRQRSPTQSLGPRSSNKYCSQAQRCTNAKRCSNVKIIVVCSNKFKIQGTAIEFSDRCNVQFPLGMLRPGVSEDKLSSQAAG